MLYVWLVPLLAWLFLFGAAVGSFLNVCIARLARGKSLVWPGSRCGACYAEIRAGDNIPLLSYWRLRGRCRDCGMTFSVRYFLVELFTALAFVALYLAEAGANVHGLPAWERGGFTYLEWASFPPYSWGLFVWHALMASLLIAASGALLEFGHVPRGVTVFGVACGLAGATLFPWPYPAEPREVLSPSEVTPRLNVDGGRAVPARGAMPAAESWARWPVAPRPGFVPWPVWGPLPDALPAGSRPLGLLTGLAGGLVGAYLLRATAWLAARGLGRAALDAGGADLMLIAGSFLGWQPAAVALVLAAGLAFLGGLPPRFAGRRGLPFAFWLTAGVVASWFGWARLGPLVRPLLFDPVLMPLVVAACLGLVFDVALLARLARAPGPAGVKKV